VASEVPIDIRIATGFSGRAYSTTPVPVATVRKCRRDSAITRATTPRVTGVYPIGIGCSGREAGILIGGDIHPDRRNHTR
jgi:hypothetical protein